MFKRLSGDFNRGYTKAIMDIAEVMKYIQDDLKYHHKTLNQKTINRLLEVILANRESLREDRNGFIRWNCKLNDFEWFTRKDL